MKVTLLSVPVALLAAVSFGVAFTPASEKLDLTPRFEEGQTFTIGQSFEADVALDELSAEFFISDGALPEGGRLLVEAAEDGSPLVEVPEVTEFREVMLGRHGLRVDASSPLEDIVWVALHPRWVETLPDVAEPVVRVFEQEQTFILPPGRGEVPVGLEELGDPEAFWFPVLEVPTTVYLAVDVE